MNRREIITRTLVGAAALAVPARVFAQAAPPPGARRVLEVAQREAQRASAYLQHTDLVGIADFGLHSAVPRFHCIKLADGTMHSAHVTHGVGSDAEHDGWLKRFSNTPNSLATSRGAYITQEQYDGRYGRSMRLGGIDPSNANAFDRAIVLHPADYAAPEHVARWGKLGRSHGCLAFGPDQIGAVLSHLWGGRLIYADALGIALD